MDIQRALKLTKASDLLRACHEAETHNVEITIVNELYRLYRAACRREGRQ